MNLPKIDISSVPGLDSAAGLFGSLAQAGGTYDDGVVVIMVYVYDTAPPVMLV